MRWPTLMVLATSLAACSHTPPPDDPVDDDGPDQTQLPMSGGPQIQAEVGALDEEKVQEAFNAAKHEIYGCFNAANDELKWPIVGGDIEVVVRVKTDSTVRWVFPQTSTIGHRATERCILDTLHKQIWPKPEGGEEGIARTQYGMDCPGREPVGWSPGDLGKNRAKLEAKVKACIRKAGTPGLSLTLHVDPDGRPISAGASVDDESGLEALDCAVEAATSLRYPSPGSYPAKVTVQVN
ncbi:MAG: hypothetical protein JRI68_06695 [Deltaproteobacteria bacterium]|nr:hypothetical protein [Deltaproteobacteria bacterium]